MYIQNLPFLENKFAHSGLGKSSNINFVGRCFSHLVGHIAIVIFFSAKLRFFKQMVMLDFDDGSKYITENIFLLCFHEKTIQITVVISFFYAPSKSVLFFRKLISGYVTFLFYVNRKIKYPINQ